MKIKHLEWIQETYWEHLKFAWSVGFVMLVHGLFPWVWQFKATEMMTKRELIRNEKIRKNRAGYE